MIWRPRAARVATAALALTTMLCSAGVLNAVAPPRALAAAWELCSGYSACSLHGYTTHDDNPNQHRRRPTVIWLAEKIGYAIGYIRGRRAGRARARHRASR